VSCKCTPVASVHDMTSARYDRMIQYVIFFNYFVVQGLPDEGLDLNIRDRDGCTPLHVALLSGTFHGM